MQVDARFATRVSFARPPLQHNTSAIECCPDTTFKNTVFYRTPPPKLSPPSLPPSAVAGLGVDGGVRRGGLQQHEGRGLLPKAHRRLQQLRQDAAPLHRPLPLPIAFRLPPREWTQTEFW